MALGRRRHKSPAVLFAPLLVSGCLSSTPFQSARVGDPGKRSGTVSLLRSTNTDPDHEEGMTTLAFTTQIPDDKGRSELRVGGALVVLDPDDYGTVVGGMFNLGGKFEIVEDRVALELPIQFMFAGTATLYTTHIYPRLIVSQPLTDTIELNLSATKFFFIEGDDFAPYGLAGGLALGRRGGAIVRPEVGVLVYPDGDTMLQFGIGFTPRNFGPDSDAWESDPLR